MRPPTNNCLRYLRFYKPGVMIYVNERYNVIIMSNVTTVNTYGF